MFNPEYLEQSFKGLKPLHSMTGKEDPFKVMAAIEKTAVVGDLQSSAVNGGAEAAALICLGARLASVPKKAPPPKKAEVPVTPPKDKKDEKEEKTTGEETPGK